MHCSSPPQTEPPCAEELANLSASASSLAASSSASSAVAASFSYRGEIIVALKFVPGPSAASGPSSSSSSSSDPRRKVRGILMVLLKEAKNLAPAKGSANADPFCKW